MTQPIDALDNPFIDPQATDLFDDERLEQDAIGVSDDDEFYAFDLDEPATGDLATVVLPNQVTRLEAVGKTDVGQQRQHNEDYFMLDNRVTSLSDPDGVQVFSRGLYILCDGMGGHAQGEVASRMATETLGLFLTERWQNEIPSDAEIEEGILWANQTLYALNEHQTRLGAGRMGTTLVLGLLQDTQLKFAHVGDSRLYRVTQKHGLEQLTVDHEVGQRNIAKGMSPQVAYARPDAFQLTQALGPRPEQSLSIEVQNLTLTEDTLFLFCSDGLTDDHLLERHWESHLQPLLDFQTSLDEGLERLINLANEENGHDNITIIAVRAQVELRTLSSSLPPNP